MNDKINPFLRHILALMLCPILFLPVSCAGETIESALQNSARAPTPTGDSTEVSLLQAKLERLYTWQYHEEPDFNIDSLSEVLSHELAAYLSTQPFPIDEHTINLGKIVTADSLLAIYTYQHSSGGTAGWLNTSIVQWKKSNGKFGAKILKLNAFFIESHILAQTKEHTLYLFIGGFRGSSRLEVAVAPVIELTRDSLNLNYPAFYGKYPWLLYYDDKYTPENYCIACIDYLPERKQIVIENLGSEDQVGVKTNQQQIKNYLRGRKKVSYTFNGKQFIEDLP